MIRRRARFVVVGVIGLTGLALLPNGCTAFGSDDRSTSEGGTTNETKDAPSESSADARAMDGTPVDGAGDVSVDGESGPARMSVQCDFLHQCVCPANARCAITCPSSCSVTCEMGSDCTVTCSGCAVQCLPKATCLYSPGTNCSGAGCHTN